MRATSGMVLVTILLIVLFSRDLPSQEEEETCGREIAAAAEVPVKWQALMDHVATNMEAHARWVGSASAAAQRERAALSKVARSYRAMAASAGQAADAMRAMRDLPPAPHDSARLDLEGQTKWMRAKIQMQRDFAALLLRHAEESEKALEKQRAAAGKAGK